MPDGANHPAELSPFHRELLTCLKEECGEVIVEVCKADRFGPDAVWSGDTPRGRLSRELGELTSIIDWLLDLGVVDRDVFVTGFQEKPAKLRTWMRHIPDDLERDT